MRRLRLVAVLTAVTIVSAACSPTASPVSSPGQSGATGSSTCTEQRYVPYVFHVPPSIPLIAVFEKGVNDAARDFSGPPYCIRTAFLAPPGFDTAKEAEILDAALAQNPAAIAVSVPDMSALGPGIKRALDAGIPVVTTNTGEVETLQLGDLVIAYVAGDEYPVAFEHGRRFAALGAKNVMCVNDNPGTSALTVRCNGIHDAMVEAGGTSKEIGASNADLVAMKNTLEAALRADPTFDAIGGVYSGDYQVALQAIDELGIGDRIKAVGSVEFQPGLEVLNDIKAGKLAFATSIDPYMQGYVPIMLLALWLENNSIPNYRTITKMGGIFVDKSNVDHFITLSGG
jgi:simple sugar transport system substrate-binding protein